MSFSILSISVRAGAPNATGTVDWETGDQGQTELHKATGCLSLLTDSSHRYPSGTGNSVKSRGFRIDLSKASSVYNNNTNTIVPNSCKTLLMIRY